MVAISLKMNMSFTGAIEQYRNDQTTAGIKMKNKNLRSTPDQVFSVLWIILNVRKIRNTVNLVESCFVDNNFISKT